MVGFVEYILLQKNCVFFKWKNDHKIIECAEIDHWSMKKKLWMNKAARNDTQRVLRVNGSHHFVVCKQLRSCLRFRSSPSSSFYQDTMLWSKQAIKTLETVTHRKLKRKIQRELLTGTYMIRCHAKTHFGRHLANKWLLFIFIKSSPSAKTHQKEMILRDSVCPSIDIYDKYEFWFAFG